MYVTKEGVHPLDQELRALLLTKVAIQGGECLLHNECECCKLYDENACILYRINKDLNELFKVVVL